MSVFEKTPLPFTWDCVRPISSLLHKFIPMPLLRGQKLIAYEVKDLKRRDRLLEEGRCGNVPLWLQEHDIVKVWIDNEGVKQLNHAAVREINCETKMAKLAILRLVMQQTNTWKVQPINQDLNDEGVGGLHEKVTDLHQDAPLDKTIENAQDDNDLVKLDDMGAIMVHEKEKEEEKSAYEDVEVYIPEIPWENNNDQNDAYEEYQKFTRDESFGVALKEMKDDTSSELCDVNIDLSSRKSARKERVNMSCPQSLLEQLLSQPHDEALKVSSAWRASYAGNKRVLGNPTSNIAYGDPPSVSKYDPKVYEQVFRPPPPMHRDVEKLYGRKFLLRHHPDQYRVLLSNYGEVGKWFAKVDSIGDLPNNLERKNHVLSIIRDKIGNLKDIVIDKAFYPWKEEDIYSWCIKSLPSKRKYSKKKIDQSMSSSSGSMPINQDLNDEGVGGLHEKVTDLHQDAPLDKTIENAQDDNDLVKLDDMGAIMVHEKEKEEEKSAYEDVEVYIPEIPWENNNDQNDAYEATSKLLELLKKKEKVLRVSKNKNKKELPRESRESTIQSSSLETKARD
ncbi:hypothetical protein L7F22_036735 [Adiantum nelumboides]|nr:hypothetical protein [Adiantum nelumboides]